MNILDGKLSRKSLHRQFSGQIGLFISLLIICFLMGSFQILQHTFFPRDDKTFVYYISDVVKTELLFHIKEKHNKTYEIRDLIFIYDESIYQENSLIHEGEFVYSIINQDISLHVKWKVEDSKISIMDVSSNQKKFYKTRL